MRKIFLTVLKTIIALSLVMGTAFIINSAFTYVTNEPFPVYDTGMGVVGVLHHECDASSPLGGSCSATCQDKCNCQCSTTWTSCTCTCKCQGGHQTSIDPLIPKFEVITISPKQYENWKAIYEILIADNSPKASEWISLYHIIEEKKLIDVVALSKQIETLLKSQSEEVRNKVNKLMKENNSDLRV